MQPGKSPLKKTWNTHDSAIYDEAKSRKNRELYPIAGPIIVN